MTVSRRLRQGDRQPRDRGAQPPEPGLPRRHAVLRVRGARGAALAVEARPRGGQGPHPRLQAGQHAGRRVQAHGAGPEAARTAKPPKAEGDVEYGPRRALAGGRARLPGAARGRSRRRGAPAAAQERALPRRDRGGERRSPSPGPRLRFGINPAGTAGALGPPVEPVPDSPGKTREALRAARARRGRAVLRPPQPLLLVAGAAGDPPLHEAHRPLHAPRLPGRAPAALPPAARAGGRTSTRWVRFVRRVVRKFGANPSVRALQVTNEVNFYPIAPDASDSYYAGAREALVRGVIAAKREAERLGYDQLKIGFNWAYRTDPGREQSFWAELGALGGEPLRARARLGRPRRLPGHGLPAGRDARGGYRDGMVNAMSVAARVLPADRRDPRRACRSRSRRTATRRSSRRAATPSRWRRCGRWSARSHEFRGTYNVTDYRWFDLRDHRTSSPNFQHQYGLLRDDYTPKPAFDGLRGAGRGAHPAALGSAADAAFASCAWLPRCSPAVGRIRRGPRLTRSHVFTIVLENKNYESPAARSRVKVDRYDLRRRSCCPGFAYRPLQPRHPAAMWSGRDRNDRTSGRRSTGSEAIAMSMRPSSRSGTGDEYRSKLSVRMRIDGNRRVEGTVRYVDRQFETAPGITEECDYGTARLDGAGARGPLSPVPDRAALATAIGSACGGRDADGSDRRRRRADREL